MKWGKKEKASEPELECKVHDCMFYRTNTLII